MSEAVEQVNARSRISYHLGEKYSGSEARAPKAAVPDRPADARPVAEPDAHIVLPFRDAGLAGERPDNLVNCLSALRDQSLPRSRYLVTVVERDARPRWRERLRPLVDECVHACKDAASDRSWSLNVGAVIVGGDGHRTGHRPLSRDRLPPEPQGPQRRLAAGARRAQDACGTALRMTEERPGAAEAVHSALGALADPPGDPLWLRVSSLSPSVRHSAR
ncbi:hypothetical protein [Streptomyces enissocaesilis]|uniref:Uncharacterized protein n=1 Tax=Streptomyces enissocaesilis TaxID=332589 RepID=A0ABN3XLW3_9ACTN